MIKRILVALDLDTDTPIAIRHAIELAEQFDASLTGLAIVDTKNIKQKVGAGGIGTIYYADMLRKSMTEESRNQAGILLRKFDEMVAQSKVRHASQMDEGVPYQRIIEELKYHDVLIIGRESHFFYNRPERETDTLADLIKKSTAPAIVVPPSYQEINKVVIAHDDSAASARTIQWFVQLEPYGTDVAIDLVHICDKDDELEADKGMLKLHLAADLLRAHGYEDISQKLLDEEGTNGEIIIDYIEHTGADLILLGAHSMSAIKRLTFGSTTHDLVKNSPVPLFICH